VIPWFGIGLGYGTFVALVILTVCLWTMPH
jgi:hypothetical protein